MLLGLAVVSTKVPSVQPVADNLGMLLEAGGLVVVVVVVVVGVEHPCGGAQVGRVVGVGGVVVGVEHPCGGAQVGRVVVAVGVLVRWQATGL